MQNEELKWFKKKTNTIFLLKMHSLDIFHFPPTIFSAIIKCNIQKAPGFCKAKYIAFCTSVAVVAKLQFLFTPFCLTTLEQVCFLSMCRYFNISKAIWKITRPTIDFLYDFKYTQVSDIYSLARLCTETPYFVSRIQQVFWKYFLRFSHMTLVKSFDLSENYYEVTLMI